nr:unnamed protein product [Digitaria exilis]
MGTISYSAPASSSATAHLVTFHDMVAPYSFIGAITSTRLSPGAPSPDSDPVPQLRQLPIWSGNG